MTRGPHDLESVLLLLEILLKICLLPWVSQVMQSLSLKSLFHHICQRRSKTGRRTPLKRKLQLSLNKPLKDPLQMLRAQGHTIPPRIMALLWPLVRPTTNSMIRLRMGNMGVEICQIQSMVKARLPVILRVTLNMVRQ